MSENKDGEHEQEPRPIVVLGWKKALSPASFGFTSRTERRDQDTRPLAAGAVLRKSSMPAAGYRARKSQDEARQHSSICC
jgi:hypothetical protein